MRDPSETPWLVAIAMLLIPVGVAAFLAFATFRRMTPLVYCCRRCHREFRRAPYRRFPAACPHCRARDWSSEHGGDTSAG